MSATSAQNSSAASEAAPEGRAPLCFVIDGDASIRHFLSLVLHGAGIDSEGFADGDALHEALAHRKPDAVFLDIPLESAEAIAAVVTLARDDYRGQVQLMSGRGAAVLAYVKSIGEQQHLSMLPPLRKPFETNAIVKLLGDLKLGDPPAVAGRIDLDEALANDWIEFWYQPKIDLRKKQLVGAEAFARARHPQHGLLSASAFMPGARESSLITLSELALSQALKAGLNFSGLGVNLRMAVDIPVKALVKLPVADIVASHRPQLANWAGLIIDVPEAEIVGDLGWAADFSKRLAHLNVKLAIDDFGRGHAALAQARNSPFAEFKLDRAFVTDCGTDKVNAPLCKTVIDLAHNFGSVAVGIGIEKASDALALVSMGCDCGQGFLLGQPMPQERFISLLRQRANATVRRAATNGAGPEKRLA
jgi:EAL domain-containing protein (putative c-di-GMP-specific phosphodiesterase class I)